VVAGGGEVSGVVLTLYPTITLTGQVVFDGAAEKPTRPPQMIAESTDGRPSGYREGSSRPGTPPETFTIEGLAPGEYYLRGRMIGGGWTVQSVTINGRQHTEIPFTVSGADDLRDVTVTMTDKAITVSGSVRDPTGGPTTSAAVLLFPADRNGWRNYGLSPDRIRMTRLTTTGGYRLTGLPAGEYLAIAVDASQADSWKDPAFLEAAARSATRVTLSWGQARTLDLTRVTVK
jgi:hypothetical protein